MYHGQITITVLEWDQVAQECVVDEPTDLVVGRSRDCDICLPKDFAHADVSRHHCGLEIDPPAVRVRDLGSRNGTFVNGMKIGQRSMDQTPEEIEPGSLLAYDLKDGDEVMIGDHVLRVGIQVADPA
jgi:pSer/pThr/pTyr-binding forkhead associated (FHA) protein